MLERLRVGGFDVNCYLASAGPGSAFILDPGAEPEAVHSALRASGLKLAGIALSHGHIDHVAGLEGLLELLAPERPPIAIHSADASSLGPEGLAQAKRVLMEIGASWLLKDGPRSIPQAELFLEEGPLPFAPGYRVIHTPGHSPGSVCLYSQAEGILLSGDTLFRGGVGRTDLAGGDEAALLSSIRRKLLALPGATKVYPGHGEETSIAQESRWF